MKPSTFERLEPHDPRWADLFEQEAERLSSVGALTELHHIGSTAVPGLLAKPIIDIIGATPSLTVLDQDTDDLARMGYEIMGEYGIPGRRYFRKSDPSGTRTHHLHVYEAGSPHIARHLLFRDYLRAHPQRAADYAARKTAIVTGDSGPARSYAEAKSALVQTLKAEAAAWAAGRVTPSR